MLIRNGRVWQTGQVWRERTDVLIRDGRVATIGAGLDAAGGPVLDATGLVVCAGLVDARAHLCEPGHESRETLATGSRAAAAGGFTTVIAMADTDPPIDNAGMVELVLRRARDAAIRVQVSACATKGMLGKELTEMAELKDAGVVYVTENRQDIESASVLRHVLEYANMVGLPYVSHCEDTSLSCDGHMHEGYFSTLLGIPAMPREAEETRMDRNIRLAEMTGAHIHIQHVSTKGGVEIIRQAKARGVRVTAETCPQYFSLTDAAVRNFDSNAKVNPPLREAEDLAAIIAGLQDGALDCLSTGHAPHTVTDKEVEFAYAPFGCVGLETALATAITYLVVPGHLPLERVLELLSAAPATVFGLDAGTLDEGSAADLCIFSPDEPWVVDPKNFESKGRNSPYAGQELRGRVRHTVCGGILVYSAGGEK